MLRLLILFAVLGCLLLVRSVQADDKAVFQPVACDMQGVPVEVQPRLSCGTLRVRSADGSSFQLAVARRAPAEPLPGHTPILYWPAGPGSAITRQGMSLPTDPVAGHELILLDFRGSGASQPKFCAGLTKQLERQMQESQHDQQWLDDRRQLLLSCQQQMLAGGFSQEDFGSAQAVADAELLREMLNISQWHIYASGHATTVALQYLTIARKSLKSVLLDAIEPPDELWMPAKTVQDNWLAQLQLVCQQQADCSQRYGSIPDLFNAALQQVAAQPLQLKAGHNTVFLTADKLRLWTWLAGRQPESLSLLPFWLQAVKQQQPALLTPWLLLSSEQLLQSVPDMAAWMAAACADHSRYYRAAALDALAQQLWLPAGVCAEFASSGDATLSLQAPVHPSQLPQRAYMRTPLLMLTGSLDVVQPDTAVLQQWLGPVSQLVQVRGGLQQIGMQTDCQIKAIRDFFLNPAQFGAPPCLSAVEAPFLVTAVHANPELSAEIALVRAGQFPLLLGVLGALLLVALLLGPIWSGVTSAARWLFGQSLQWQPLAVYTNGYLLVLLATWSGLAYSSWRVQLRGSGEFWYGLPAGDDYWRMALAILSLFGLWGVHQLSAARYWRLLFAVTCLLVAALLGVSLHLLP